MNLHWPAEWATQSALMLTWPHVDTDWGEDYTRVEPVFDAIARLAATQCDVIIAAPDPAAVRQRLSQLPLNPASVQVHACPSNDVWVRDHGPVTVIADGQRRYLDFRFDAWGGKFDADLDDALTRTLHAASALPAGERHPVDWTLEGGGIETDGVGTMLTTRRCLLDTRRNPGASIQRVETLLAEHLGIARTHWLQHGHLEGDDTDSHIDTLARFASPDVIIHQACDDTLDAHHDDLASMADELRKLRTPAGHAYELVPLPLPKPQVGDDGRRLPAGYANFLILNDIIMVPTYHTPADDLALRRIDEAFRQRVEPVDCRALVTQNGSLHCATMNLPATASELA